MVNVSLHIVTQMVIIIELNILNEMIMLISPPYYPLLVIPLRCFLCNWSKFNESDRIPCWNSNCCIIWSVWWKSTMEKQIRGTIALLTEEISVIVNGKISSLL